MSSSLGDVIYCYGNCQLKSIAAYLRAIPEVVERYPTIEYFYVLDDVSRLNREKLARAKVFLYQHTTVRALVGSTEETRLQSTSEYIVDHILPKDCVSISVPSVYSSILFPNAMSTSEAQVGFPDTVSADHFPNYAFSRRLHQMLLDRIEVNEIVSRMCNEDAYSVAELERNEQQNYENLRKREIDNNVTIPLAQYIRDNFRNHRLLHSTNHPTRLFFDYLLNEILKLMKCSPSSIALDMEDPMTTLARLPVLPCVVKHLQLDMSHSSYADTDIWVLGRSFASYKEYVVYLAGLLAE